MTDWNNIEFSKGELGHYSRHLSIPEFGMEGQKKLKYGTRSLLLNTPTAEDEEQTQGQRIEDQ